VSNCNKFIKKVEGFAFKFMQMSKNNCFKNRILINLVTTKASIQYQYVITCIFCSFFRAFKLKLVLNIF